MSRPSAYEPGGWRMRAAAQKRSADRRVDRHTRGARGDSFASDALGRVFAVQPDAAWHRRPRKAGRGVGGGASASNGMPDRSAFNATRRYSEPLSDSGTRFARDARGDRALPRRGRPIDA